MNAATISTRNSRPIPDTIAPMNFCPYSTTRRLSPSVDFSRSDSQRLIERSHLPPPPTSAGRRLGWRDDVLAALAGTNLEHDRLQIEAELSVGQRLEHDGARLGRSWSSCGTASSPSAVSAPKFASTHAPARGSHSLLTLANSWGASRNSRAKSPDSFGMKYPMKQAQAGQDVDVEDDDRGRARERPAADAQPAEPVDQRRQDVRDQDREQERAARRRERCRRRRRRRARSPRASRTGVTTPGCATPASSLDRALILPAPHAGGYALVAALVVVVFGLGGGLLLLGLLLRRRLRLHLPPRPACRSAWPACRA